MSKLDNIKNIKKNESLALYTTFKIGGPAKYFLESENTEEIKKALILAKEENLPVFILGGGSNILVSDNGFSGLVIKTKFNNLDFDGEKITVGAGINLSKLVMQSVEHNLTGLEWAMGIPGTIGGAVCGNAGAWGGEIKDIVESIKILRDGKEIILSNQECDFKYRHSAFKNNNDIIIEIILKLGQGSKEASQKIIKEHLDKKINTQDTTCPTSGCVFKNIKIEDLSEQELAKVKDKILPEFLDKGIIPTGWLIDQCGLRGSKMGGAEISEKHANFIINKNNATASDIASLISLAQEKVLDKFDLKLEEEIQLVGF